MKKQKGLSPLTPETESIQRTHKKHIYHTRFKVIIALLVILVISTGILACHSFKGQKDPSSTSDQLSAADETERGQVQPEQGASDGSSADGQNSKNTGTAEKTQHIGAEKYGFLTVPSTWKTFNDPDASSITGSSIKQYCDETGKLIITLNCTENPQTDAKNAASSCWAQMEQDGAADIQGATVQIADCAAYQVYGYYTDDDVMLVIWVFTDSDGILHYISAEGPIDSVMDAVKLVEKTFTLSKN